MNTPIFTAAQPLLQQTASLLVYQSVLEDHIGQAYLQLLAAVLQAEDNNTASQVECLKAYGQWFRLLASRQLSWQDYLLLQLLQDENPFTQQAQRQALADLPAPLVAAARHDLQALQTLYECPDQQLSQWVQIVAHCPVMPISWNQAADDPRLNQIKPKLQTATSWGDALAALGEFYQRYGVGMFAADWAFRWQGGQFVGIANPDPVRLEDLVGYEEQRAILLKNTEFLLQGYPALHVLLYGSRGSGKSSLVKGLLHRFGDRHLRLVEVAKSDLTDLPVIVERLRHQPQKFIIFVDDLSFEEDEAAYKALKVVLEGNLTARSPNVIVYATSNRRHLIREFFGDRPRPKDSEEVHAWDTVQEKLSFSDRFGLTLTFEPANQDTYLQIVRHLAARAGITLAATDLEYRALQWATRHNGRSGRTARQFVDFLQADLALGE